ncbi:MAG TPA: hypothetical protein V6C99_05250 [Oculatellaceae cyanobacterium]|jgi:capsular polysaccharide biosynthesis protein
MSTFLARTTLALSLLAFGLSISASGAWAFAPDNELMKVKGYSPEVIHIADTQRSRQEWREPAPPRLTPLQRFFHNIYKGNWTESVDEFGYGVLRDP